MSSIILKQFGPNEFEVRYLGKGHTFTAYDAAKSYASALQAASPSNPKPKIKELLFD